MDLMAARHMALIAAFGGPISNTTNSILGMSSPSAAYTGTASQVDSTDMTTKPETEESQNK